mmetsp:Transcript_25712/g.42779  ORF Transcript_25712/g.42779 Transcript_25712/m.42779 type:complete len:134 (-) Transcript_25712:802-1203(-)
MASEQASASASASASPEQASNRDGIDIVKALDILSMRAGDDHNHDHEHHGDCHEHVPDGGKTMGQSIDMTQTEEGAKAIIESMESQRQELAEARRKRGTEIQATLESLTVRELLASVMETQTARVATYREYDE